MTFVSKHEPFNLIAYETRCGEFLPPSLNSQPLGIRSLVSCAHNVDKLFSQASNLSCQEESFQWVCNRIALIDSLSNATPLISFKYISWNYWFSRLLISIYTFTICLMYSLIFSLIQMNIKVEVMQSILFENGGWSIWLSLPRYSFYGWTLRLFTDERTKERSLQWRITEKKDFAFVTLSHNWSIASTSLWIHLALKFLTST